jgi:archaeoflavoprotein AfpA
MSFARKKKVAWGITGAGDRLSETINVMQDIRNRYEDKVDIQVYTSEAGTQVLKYYKLSDCLKQAFNRVWVEVNANTPFLAGQLQLKRFEFLLIAPATANTVAKISMGIADSLLSNAASMGLKASIPVYIMPSDYKEGTVVTKLPDGQVSELRTRKEDLEHVKRLSNMNHVFVLEKPEDIHSVFKKHFGKKR